MVLPEKHANVIRSLADGGGSAGGGIGAVHFNVTALDAKSVGRFFRDNGRSIASALQTQFRNGAKVKA
jgi:hypothetical protein